MEDSMERKEPMHARALMMDFIGKCIISPTEIHDNIDAQIGTQDASSSPHSSRLISNAVSLFWLTLIIAFTFYLLFFAYPTLIFWTETYDPVYQFQIPINIGINLVVSFFFFEIWKILDNLLLKVVMKYPKDHHIILSRLLRLSFVPILPALGIFSFLRLIYAGIYLRWGLVFIPLINIGILLLWRYGLLYILLSPIYRKKNEKNKLKIGIVLALILTMVFSITFSFIVPILFNTTALEFIYRVF